MRKPSSHSQELLRAAANPALVDTALADVLTGLGHSHEPAVLPGLVPYVLYPEPTVALAARQAVLRLLQATPVRELVWLDQTLRGWSRHHAPNGLAAFDAWDRLRPGWLRMWSSEPQGLAVLLLASLHHSGYVREVAVQQLAQLSLPTDATQGSPEDGAEVPFLLLRLNDWVGPVQQTAVAALKQRLVASYAPQLVRSVYLIEQLASYRRRDHESLLHALRTFLGSLACREALLHGLNAPDRLVQRPCYLLLLNAETVSMRTAVLAGLASSDMLVRVWAARAARRHLYGRDLVEALGQARKDRAMPVRMEAVHAFVNDHPELQVLLLDPSKSIREAVRFYIRKHANIDFAALYCRALGDATRATLPIILLSIGETGNKTAASLVAPYADHGELRVRKAALHALGQLAAETSIPILYAALLDSHRGVARTAWEALRPQAERLDPGQLKVWLGLREEYGASA